MTKRVRKPNGDRAHIIVELHVRGVIRVTPHPPISPLLIRKDTLPRVMFPCSDDYQCEQVGLSIKARMLESNESSGRDLVSQRWNLPLHGVSRRESHHDVSTLIFEVFSWWSKAFSHSITSLLIFTVSIRR